MTLYFEIICACSIFYDLRRSLHGETMAQGPSVSTAKICVFELASLIKHMTHAAHASYFIISFEFISSSVLMCASKTGACIIG